MIHNLIYFDNNATTRLHPEVLQVMLPYFSEEYGNASSKMHAKGWSAAAAVQIATEQIAKMIGCEVSEIIFTSGATESVNLAMKGIYEAYKSKGNHIITCKTEHKAVLDVCDHLETQGAEITRLNVDREGKIDLHELENEIKKSTVMVSIMAANNETGVIQDVEAIAEICTKHKIIFFSDATQFAGKQRCNVKELGIHCMAFNAHKMYGPKGVGALYIRRKDPRVNVLTQMHGGGHQNNKRSGTLNVPGIAGFGKAAELFTENHWDWSSNVSRIKNHFEHQLLDVDGLRINGSTRSRLYNTSNLLFPSQKDLKKLVSSFAFSSGSACSSDVPEPSHVLLAMGLTAEEIKTSYRFSFGIFNTIEECDELIKAIHQL